MTHEAPEASVAPPVLSTPAEHIFEDDIRPSETPPPSRLSPEQISLRYEIDRTVAEIKRGQWKRIALQFPDDMLSDAPTVFDALNQQLHRKDPLLDEPKQPTEQPLSQTTDNRNNTKQESYPRKLFILGDTSYGACCVDEIAAEHVNADVVVHYGRACLSPTARLPVIHVFTRQPLDLAWVVETFELLYPDRDQSLILMADVMYATYLSDVGAILGDHGYSHIFITDIVHNPSSPIPNRTVPEAVSVDPTQLQHWQLFHISDPPESLLLTLASRLSTIHIFPTTASSSAPAAVAPAVSSSVALRRRYALLTSVSTASIFGILINTLSVKNYIRIVDHVKECISAAGKKSYTFVVGKIHAAKVANFSEIGAWVVVGCWESSLIDSKDFWRPILTPFELQLALVGDEARIWTGQWSSNFESLLKGAKERSSNAVMAKPALHSEEIAATIAEEDYGSEPESAPPEFDLRTGRYVSQTRPMQRRLQGHSHQQGYQRQETSLVERTKREVATIGNQVSPGAEFLRSSRTWKGLGSDVDVEYDLGESSKGVPVEEGRSGLAKGYTTAESSTRV
ncbi:MAG: hypothetical protein LQ350_001799 [Teloschistes chrysophthalmus]|nr:MAG: hypothetical protein LQ350_001799 [Niorma chrysophthalma]